MIGNSKVIGITGTIASGKSLVGKLLVERSFPVIDADEVVHSLFQHSESMRNSIVARFGQGILTEEGTRIDRKKLGTIVFNNQEARHDLEQIVHPATIQEVDRRVKAAAEAGHNSVFVLVPLLFEAGQGHRYDEIWCVKTDLQILRERLRSRNHLTDTEIDRRLAAQWPQEQKISHSNRVIDNSGTINDTKNQIDILVSQM